MINCPKCGDILPILSSPLIRGDKICICQETIEEFNLSSEALERIKQVNEKADLFNKSNR